MEKGKSLDEAKVKTALEAKKLKFVSLETKQVPPPKAAYVLAASGAT